MSNTVGSATVAIIPDLTQFTAGAVAIGNLVADSVEFGLKKASDFLKTLPAVGQELQDAFNTVKVQTGATGDALISLDVRLQSVGRNTSQKLGDIGSSIGVLNQRFADLGEGKLTQITQQFADLSTITGTNLKSNVDNLGGALLIFNTKPEEMSKRMDEALRATQAAGVSLGDIIPTLNSVGASLQGVGFDYEQSLGFVGAFAKAGLDATQSQLALGKIAKLASKDGITASEEWQKLNNTWKSASTQQEAFSEGAQVLGTRAARMAVLVHDGTLNFDDLTKSISTGKETIEGTTASTDTFAREWKTMVNELKVDLTGPSTTLNNALMNVVKSMRGVLRSLIDDVGGAIGPALESISKVLGPAIVNTFTALTPTITAFASLLANIFLASGPLIDAVVQSIAAFSPIITNIVNQITIILFPAIRELGPIFTKFADGMKPVVEVLGNTFISALAALVPAFIAMADAMAPIAGHLGEELARVISQLVPLFVEIVIAGLPLITLFADLMATDIIPLFIDLLVPIAKLTAAFITWTEHLLNHRKVLLPLIILIGAFWTAWKGWEILGLATKAMVDFAATSTASMKRITSAHTAMSAEIDAESEETGGIIDRLKGRFTAMSEGVSADTTTLQGSTTAIVAALQEVLDALNIIIGKFDDLIITMGSFSDDSIVVADNFANIGLAATDSTTGIDLVSEAIGTMGTTAGTSSGEVEVFDGSLAQMAEAADAAAAAVRAFITGAPEVDGALATIGTTAVESSVGLDELSVSLDAVAASGAAAAVGVAAAGTAAVVAGGEAALAAVEDTALAVAETAAAGGAWAMFAGLAAMEVPLALGIGVIAGAGIAAVAFYGHVSDAANKAQKSVSDAQKDNAGNMAAMRTEYDKTAQKLHDQQVAYDNMNIFSRIWHVQDRVATEAAITQNEEFGKHIKENENRIRDLSDIIHVSTDNLQKFGDSINLDWSGLDPSIYTPLFQMYQDGVITSTALTKELNDAINHTGNYADDNAPKMENFTNKVDEFYKKIHQSTDPVKNLTGAEDTLAKAKLSLIAAQKKVDAGGPDSKANQDALAKAIGDVASASDAVTTAMTAVSTASDVLGIKVGETGDVFDIAIQSVTTMGTAQGLTATQIDIATQAIRDNRQAFIDWDKTQQDIIRQKQIDEINAVGYIVAKAAEKKHFEDILKANMGENRLGSDGIPGRYDPSIPHYDINQGALFGLGGRPGPDAAGDYYYKGPLSQQEAYDKIKYAADHRTDSGIPKSDFAHFSLGGIIQGLSGIDKIPALVSAGEGILNRDAMMKLGTDNFHAINSGESINTNSGNVAIHVTVQPPAGADSRWAHEIGKNVGDAAAKVASDRLRIQAAVRSA